ncbi:unnamed protein product [Fraxinus pennsylvanica]|uniref:Cytochrome P450 n=1 Tax=Fraxinus pennsylvanica TaxID=56036 RepID=A0AAD2DYC9_9LAMI|nr:unnamed protein product [Fraxinus pennsylvanica]
MVAGKRYFGENEDNKEAKHVHELIDEAFSLGVGSNLGDFLPILRWIDYKGHEKNLARLSEKMDAFLQGLIEEHRHNKNGNTMIDHLLSLQESQPEYYTDTIIKWIMTVMLNAGTYTSAATIEWALSVLLNHQAKLERAKAEIDSLVGNDRLVEESDLSKLHYLQAIISETFRLFPAIINKLKLLKHIFRFVDDNSYFFLSNSQRVPSILFPADLLASMNSETYCSLCGFKSPGA